MWFLELCALLPLVVGNIGEPARVYFVNAGHKTAVITWVSPDTPTASKVVANVLPGHEHDEDCWTGHTFEIKVEGLTPKTVQIKSEGKLIFKDDTDSIRVEKAGAMLAATSVHSGPEWEAVKAKVRTECQKPYVSHPNEAKYFCSDKFDHRLHVTARSDYLEETWRRKLSLEDRDRERRIREQPMGLKNFTPLGFEIRELPGDLRNSILGYYASARLTAKPENLPVFDPNLNSRESDTWLLALPSHIVEPLKATMRKILAAWAKLPEDDLQFTAMYGIRSYHNGSVLQLHVDRRETHVLSAIIQVEHLSFVENEDTTSVHWPLHIIGHDGKTRKVNHVPGRMILYESATCPHGRPTPFIGREFANIFIHFAPRGWPEAYEVMASSSPVSQHASALGAMGWLSENPWTVGLWLLAVALLIRLVAPLLYRRCRRQRVAMMSILGTAEVGREV
eukprot:TRINITY_DN33543_c0_g1_i1.p1 TRINITY_DN33543_c0_g1~~TRINITY_DN33543_c0_g1_i1.p1  ORF type:complete len:461 (+),score=59.89 TRINITY_DN33543_c0_g1_i1:34-1383(+)